MMAPWVLVGVAILVGVAWWPLRTLKKGPLWLGTIVLLGILFGIPWLASRSSLLSFGALTLISGAALPAKLIDSAVAPRIWRGRTFREWAYFLGLPFVVCYRGHLRDPVRLRSESVRFFVRGLLEMVLGLALARWAFAQDWSHSSPIVEHVVKLTALYLFAADGAFVFVTGALRLTGFTIHDLVDHPILATTPADFWRRYNRDASRFFFENLYRRLPYRSPALRTLTVFMANGLVHEYLVWILCGRILGYQLAFFSLQGIAVILTARWRPTGFQAIVSRCVTIVFMIESSTIFLASVDAVLPWFQRR